MVSALDVYQQQQVIDRLQAEIPLVQAEKSRLVNELSVLLGKVPGSILGVNRKNFPELSPTPPAGIPADLLENRPDIRAAFKRLKSAGWNVTAARADRLPSISLNARGVLSSSKMNLLLDNWILSLAANITAPIFDGNRRSALVDRNIAVVDENLAFYRKTVLEAIREVENSLVTEAKQREHITKLEKVISTARKALRQAVLRYRNGLTDYLPVLTQISAVQDLDRNLIIQRQNLAVNRVRLYRAIGGAWANEATSPERFPGL
jgi:outer membrane protein TolC